MEKYLTAAQELNEVLGLQPPISPDMDETLLKWAILEAMELIDYENDVFTDDTLDVFKALTKEKNSKKAEKASGKGKPAAVPAKEKNEPIPPSVSEPKGGPAEPASPDAPAKKRVGVGGVPKQAKVDFLTPLLKSGKHTSAELVEMLVKQFPTLTKSSAQTFMSDARSAKYTAFSTPVTMDENKHLHL